MPKKQRKRRMTPPIAQPAGDQLRDTARDDELHGRITAASKLITEESSRLVKWCLSIIGGSILAIVSTEYVTPQGLVLYTYFLFVVGWGCLGASIFNGENLARMYIADAFTPKNDLETAKQIGAKMNRTFRYQLRYFYAGIVFFGIWLVIFLTWFIIDRKVPAHVG